MEHLGADKKKASGRKVELTQLKASVDARHADPYLLNRRLRAELRVRSHDLSGGHHPALHPFQYYMACSGCCGGLHSVLLESYPC